jgi:crotonobetainyl-CoA:carnitine CoA-transferase CaiB-like acyl-CoA transferase
MVPDLAMFLTHLGIRIRFKREPGEVRRNAPRLGEHTAGALRAEGLGEAELDAAPKIV